MRQTLLAQTLPGLFGTDRGAVLGRDDDNAAVSHTQSLGNFALEVKVTGSVDEVQNIIFIFHGSQAGLDRDLTLDLLGIVVTDGVALSNLAQAVDTAGTIQQALDQRSLTLATVTQQANVTNFLHGICHSFLSLQWLYLNHKNAIYHFIISDLVVHFNNYFIHHVK